MVTGSLKLLAILIHQDDILLLVGEHLCQVRTDFSGSCDDYSHGVVILLS